MVDTSKHPTQASRGEPRGCEPQVADHDGDECRPLVAERMAKRVRSQVGGNLQLEEQKRRCDGEDAVGEDDQGFGSGPIVLSL